MDKKDYIITISGTSSRWSGTASQVSEMRRTVKKAGGTIQLNSAWYKALPKYKPTA